MRVKRTTISLILASLFLLFGDRVNVPLPYYLQQFRQEISIQSFFSMYDEHSLQQLTQGVEYGLFGDYFVAKIDTTKTQIEASKPQTHKVTALEYLANHEGIFAFNGDQFEWTSNTATSLHCYTDAVGRQCLGEENKSPAIIVYKNGTVEIGDPQPPYQNIVHVISGNNTLLDVTQPSIPYLWDTIPPDIWVDHRNGDEQWGNHNRTLVGIAQNTLYVVQTPKISLFEAAEIMQYIGAQKAINFDGGSSVQYAYRNKDHILGKIGIPVVNFIVVSSK